MRRWETPLVPMQKRKHWNAKYRPKPQLWSLHQDVFKARLCWSNLHNMSDASHYQWGSRSLRMTWTAFATAYHLYHEIPRLEPRKSPKKLFHHKQQKRGSLEEEGMVRRETIGGKNLSASQLEARTLKKGHSGASPKSQSWRHQLWLPDPGSHPQSPNNQKRPWLILSNCPNFKCHL